ncbi:MAG: SMI1/KNR4 family protein [Sphingobacteriaceae bacterium]|nr:MAG: SMI1/KNR4 family protein [Sphingobacteriaceae bacterium]
MKTLLKTISENALDYETFNFTSEQKETKWLGNVPTSNKQVFEIETRLGIILPQDYKDFLFTTNGFSAPDDTEPSFLDAGNVDFLKNIDNFIIEAYNIPELNNAIVVAGLDEEQYFLLIPPTPAFSDWKYWKFANWIPGEQAFDNLEQYFESVLKFQNE